MQSLRRVRQSFFQIVAMCETWFVIGFQAQTAVYEFDCRLDRIIDQKGGYDMRHRPRLERRSNLLDMEDDLSLPFFSEAPG